MFKNSSPNFLKDTMFMKIIIVIPCYNEETVLEKNIKEISEAVKNIPHDVKIIISDNNSKDKTAEIGQRLAVENDNIDYVFVGEPGKGAAVMEAWKQFDADVYGFMDADLATDLEALPRALKYFEEKIPPLTPPLITRGEKDDILPPLEKEGGGEFYDVVIGSRRVAGAGVKRELYRKFTSSALNFIVKILLKTKIKDTPCGFKFIIKKVMQEIVPQIRDRKWVFDTEMVILSERAGFKIKEMPVKWEERGERRSSVNVYPTAREYIKKIFEIRKRVG
jgi:glycosyltransferase involved in cell wall biosynthesis